jgi:hypothetical protein
MYPPNDVSPYISPDALRVLCNLNRTKKEFHRFASSRSSLVISQNMLRAYAVLRESRAVIFRRLHSRSSCCTRAQYSNLDVFVWMG